MSPSTLAMLVLQMPRFDSSSSCRTCNNTPEGQATNYKSQANLPYSAVHAYTLVCAKHLATHRAYVWFNYM